MVQGRTHLTCRATWPITHASAVGLIRDARNTWWAFKPKSYQEAEKALCFGLTALRTASLFGRRVGDHGSAWMQMKKPGWASMPVLDVHSLSSEQANALATAYDSLSTQD